MLRIEPLRIQVWAWSRQPYARERGLLWVTVTVGYRYMMDGAEVAFP